MTTITALQSILRSRDGVTIYSPQQVSVPLERILEDRIGSVVDRSLKNRYRETRLFVIDPAGQALCVTQPIIVSPDSDSLARFVMEQVLDVQGNPDLAYLLRTDGPGFKDRLYDLFKSLAGQTPKLGYRAPQPVPEEICELASFEQSYAVELPEREARTTALDNPKHPCGLFGEREVKVGTSLLQRPIFLIPIEEDGRALLFDGTKISILSDLECLPPELAPAFELSQVEPLSKQDLAAPSGLQARAFLALHDQRAIAAALQAQLHGYTTPTLPPALKIPGLVLPGSTALGIIDDTVVIDDPELVAYVLSRTLRGVYSPRDGAARRRIPKHLRAEAYLSLAASGIDS